MQKHQQYSKDPLLNQIAHALYSWLGGNNYDKTVKYGRKLEELQDYFPKNTTTSPSKTLYRAILVKDSALEKCLYKNKPLVLRNRRYSSWTWDRKAAWEYSDVLGGYEDKTPVIFKQTFSGSDILLNVEEMLKYFVYTSVEYAKDQLEDFGWEHEIIIKNSAKDFKFTNKNIHLYDNEGDWIKPEIGGKIGKEL